MQDTDDISETDATVVHSTSSGDTDDLPDRKKTIVQPQPVAAPVAPTIERTLHAQQAVKFADLFEFKFVSRTIGSPEPRHLELTEPDGLSTGGGLKARQSIVLVPNDKKGGGASILCGWLDASTRHAELRSFTVLADQWRARHQTGIDITKAAYDALLEEVRAFLQLQKFDVTRVEAAPIARVSSAAPTREKISPRAATSPRVVLPRRGMTLPTLVAMVVLGALVGFAIAYLVLRG